MTFSDMEDLITISFPVYNVASTIERSLMSALNQTYSNIEYLIGDDCGSDNRMDILKNILHNTSRKEQVNIIRHSSNIGLGAVRNTSIENASGKYIYFMDSDDYLEPEALESCYIKCERQALDFVFFDADILNKEKQKNISFVSLDYFNIMGNYPVKVFQPDGLPCFIFSPFHIPYHEKLTHTNLTNKFRLWFHRHEKETHGYNKKMHGHKMKIP